jgi:hypothetical protein
VTLSDGGTASGGFTYDAATNTYSNINIVTTTAGTRSGATYVATSSGFAADSKGILAITTNGSPQGLPGLTLIFSPILPAPGGVSTLSGQEADCADAGCTTPSGVSRTITAGTVSSLGASSPRTWYLNGVTFLTGGGATGSFTFDPGTNLFTNVNIITFAGTRGPATYTTMSTGVTADPTGVLNVTSAAGNQTGLPGFAMFFSTPLTGAGGTSGVTGQEADCGDPGCTMPTGTTRAIFMGTVTTVPALNIVKTHVGNFTQGQIGAQYSVAVSNSGVAPTFGQVTMTETPPAGLTITGMSGTGWNCNTSVCSRSDSLPGGAGYPAITVTVNVAANATSPVTNQVSVSGGGSAGVNATDATAIVGAGPALTISKTHSGNFVRGQVGAQYTVTVGNVSGMPTNGLVTMTETAPAGLTITGMSGTGWTCNTSTCTRSDALNSGASYSPITVTVTVAANATSPQVNQVSVSGGGLGMATASDSTTIANAGQTTLSVNRSVLNFGFNGLLITSPQAVLVTISGNTAWTATSDHPNITVNPSSGVGTGLIQIIASPGASGVVTVSSPGASGSPATILVNVATVLITQPFGSFDTPINNTTGVVGAIPVTGWALDNVEVTRVDILREPITGEGAGTLIFVGTAVFSADARPDVQAQFPTFPFNYRAGWGYQLLTNVLPNSSGTGAPGNGTYKLHAIAFNKGGNQFDLGTKTITVNNASATKPFGTIDTPGQGATISGNDSVNFGWALTPQPGMIAIDGSTISVIIDGTSVGHPTYNQFRQDIANVFPGYANTAGAVGFFHINTTTLTNGVHTISWNVFDNLARGEGLGSRYFTVQNTAGPIAVPEEPIPDTAAKEGVQLRHGLNRRSRPIAPDSDGGYSVTMEEVGLIELNLGAVRGNLLVQDETHELPIGSTLKGGVFYWQPGPGFLGDYTMQFERPDGTKVPLHVKIVPKSY